MFSYCNKLMISSVQTVFKRYAGHSKWQNIRHTKAAKDMEKGLLFSKLGQRIKIAIQETGNADPAYNVKLSQAIETAKSKHMPSATIQSFITQAKKDGANAKIVWIDVRGPKGIFIILQFLTDTPQKLKNEVTNINKKFGLTIENNLRKHFSHKGTVFAKPKNDIIDIEDHESVVHAIESGAEDVEHDIEENMLKFICGPLDIKKVSEKLTELGYAIEDAEDIYLPHQTVTVDDTTVEQLSKYIEKLNNIPGLIKIYDNIL